MSSRTFIKHLSHFHPEGVITNAKFEKFIDTTSDWIVNRTGIRERRYMATYRGDFPGVELAKQALQIILSNPKFDKNKIGMIISASTHDDIHYPNAGNIVSEELGLEVPVFQIKVACTSVAYAMYLARCVLSTSDISDVLILNGEAFTKYVDYGDRSSSILFGDGATAMVVSKESGEFEILDIEVGGKGLQIVQATRVSETSHLSAEDIAAGELTLGKPTINRRKNSEKKFQQEGKKVVDFVLKEMPSKIRSLLVRHSIDPTDLGHVISHQSNLIMMNQLWDELGIPSEKRLYNVDRFGNTGSAGWVSVLSEYKDSIGAQDLVLSAVFGAGMTWSNLLLRKTG